MRENVHISKFLPIIFFASLIICLCSACTKNNIQQPDSFSIVDQAGREVRIESTINKISSAYYISTSALVALRQKDKLATIDDKTSSIPLFKNYIEQVANLPTSGNSKQFNVETALANKAEVVIIPMGLKDYIEKFKQVNLPSIIVAPENQESFYTMIDILGKTCNCSEDATSLINYIKLQYTDLSSILKVDNYPSVYFASNSNILCGAVSNSFQNYLIEQSGCLNVLNDVEDSNIWKEIGYENLVMKNPEYIILPSNCTYTVDDVLHDPKLSNCSAVLNKNIYKMPGSIEYWDSPVPASFLGAYWLANIVHPNRVSNTEYINRAEDFYNKFYEIDISDLI